MSQAKNHYARYSVCKARGPTLEVSLTIPASVPDTSEELQHGSFVPCIVSVRKRTVFPFGVQQFVSSFVDFFFLTEANLTQEFKVRIGYLGYAHFLSYIIFFRTCFILALQEGLTSNEEKVLFPACTGAQQKLEGHT